MSSCYNLVQPFDSRDAAGKVMYNKTPLLFDATTQRPRKTSRINNVFMTEFFYFVAEKKRRGYNTEFPLFLPLQGLYITVACLLTIKSSIVRFKCVFPGEICQVQVMLFG